MEDNSMKTTTHLRHKAEMPTYITGIIVNIVIIILLSAFVFSGVDLGEDLEEYKSALSAFLALPILILVILFWRYAKIRGNAIQISESQFPDVYNIYHNLAMEMGFEKGKIPKLYLMQSNGTINAYATKCDLRKSYAVIYADIFEVVRFHNDYTTLKFILAHELAHISLGHVNIRRQFLTYFAGLFPPYRQTFTRSQELSADRVAANFVPEGIDTSLFILNAGKNLYPEVNREAYLEQVQNAKKGIFLRAVNLMSSHPIMSKRMLALEKIKKHGLEKHGDLF